MTKNHQACPDFVVVTPVYEDAEAAKKLFSNLQSQFGSTFSLVAVDDGSLAHPLTKEILQATKVQGVVLELKRNLGHQRAIAIGINYASTHFPNSNIVVMDSDGEDSPNSIPQLLKALTENVDIVVAERRSRVESFKFQAFYALYKKFFKLFTGKVINFGNFMAIKPAAAKRLAVMQELWLHLAACVLVSKLRIVRCPIDRASRYAGKSKMNFVGLVLHGVKGLMVFAEEVFVRVGIFCAAVAFISILLMPIPLVLKMAGLATPGWSSMLIGLFLLIFIQTGTLTLLTLLLTGLAKGRGIIAIDYQSCILQISENLNEVKD